MSKQHHKGPRAKAFTCLVIVESKAIHPTSGRMIATLKIEHSDVNSKDLPFQVGGLLTTGVPGTKYAREWGWKRVTRGERGYIWVDDPNSKNLNRDFPLSQGWSVVLRFLRKPDDGRILFLGFMRLDQHKADIAYLESTNEAWAAEQNKIFWVQPNGYGKAFEGSKSQIVTQAIEAGVSHEQLVQGRWYERPQGAEPIEMSKPPILWKFHEKDVEGEAEGAFDDVQLPMPGTNVGVAEPVQ